MELNPLLNTITFIFFIEMISQISKSFRIIFTVWTLIFHFKVIQANLFRLMMNLLESRTGPTYVQNVESLRAQSLEFHRKYSKIVLNRNRKSLKNISKNIRNLF
jgi:hypothetical protein